MALSGRVTSDRINSHWELSIEWSATQNISNNTSTVTARMYWESVTPYGEVRSSVTKSGAIIIDGTTYSFTASAALSNGQKKLIATKSKTISHNSNGSRSFAIDGYFDVEVNISGWVGRANIKGKTFSLNTIPRTSSVSSSVSFTAGSNYTLSISRASSSFNHLAYIDVRNSSGDWVNITSVSFSTSQTSRSSSFTTAEIKKVFQALNGRSSMDTRVNLRTYSGNTYIGYETKTGTVKIPAVSTLNNVSGGAGTNSLYVDDSYSFSIKRNHSAFTHTIEITLGSYTKRITGVGTSTSWNPSTSEESSLYTQIGSTATSRSGTARIYTYYEGEQVGGTTTKSLSFHVRSTTSRPTFSVSGITYMDTSSDTVAITGNSANIIQNRSTLRVSIPAGSRAVAKDGASITRYSVTLNGDTTYGNYSSSATVNIDVGLVDVASNTSATIRAIDSRGLSTAVTLPINMIPYSSPMVTAKAERANGFESTTTLSLRGTASSLTVGGSAKNSIQRAWYRFKDSKVTAWSTWYPFTYSGFPSFTASNVVREFDALTTWDVEIEVADKLSVTTRALTVDVGRPIMFMDAEKRSVGIGDFPTGEYELKINGRLVFGSTSWATGDAGGDGATVGGAIDLNNGDIMNANGIYFADVANNRGEGLLFARTETPAGSTNRDDYDCFFLQDGVMYYNQGHDELGVGNHLNMRNKDIRDVGHLTIADYGGYEGIEWLGGSLWRMVESPNDASNVAGPFQLFAGGSNRKMTVSTTGNVFNTGSYFKVENSGNNYFVSDGTTILKSDMASAGYGIWVGADTTGPRVWSLDIYNRTYSTQDLSPNVGVTVHGTLGRVSSASKYKLLIEDVPESERLSEKLLTLEPKSWFSKGTVENYADYLSEKSAKNNPELDEDYVQIKRSYGLIAEEVESVGLDMFVSYGLPDENGKRELEGVNYSVMWVPLIPAVRKTIDRVDKLEAELAITNEQLKNVQSQLDAIYQSKQEEQGAPVQN